ncbi:MAG: ABC transporter substrate-binding protein, partial [Actinomycetota bacterium]|nr:ABC transporter substrate-binding protein [Actinomycetota bacterium]
DDGGGTDGDKPYAGTTVTILSSIRDVEAERLEAAWADFEAETGIDIKHEGSATFEDDIKLRTEGGDSPDLAFVPQPGLLATLVAGGKVVPLTNLKADVEANDIAGWVDFGTVNGEFYAPPFGANIKSLVWYSPAAFEEGGYAIPTTWQEMLDLSDKIVADGGTPWCVGAESGGATGWVLTDWVEDFVLRTAGPEVYDQWVAHEIPFNDPAIVTAIDAVGTIVKNDDYVLDGSQSIPSTSFQEAGLPLLDGGCYMHRQANFYGNQFPEGTTKGPEGQVNAFYLPTVNADDPKVMLGGGELITAFSDKPEVEAVAKFLTSKEYADNRLALGNWMSPNKNADISLVTDPLEQTFAKLLVESDVFRFDGSDLMPGPVGAGTFWSEMVEWVVGNQDTQETV